MANVIVTSQTSTSTMKIKSISNLTSAFLPEVIIHGIPWKIKACKNKGKKSLSVYLQCAKKDTTSNWVAPAYAKIKLTCHSTKKKALEYHITPHPFNKTSLSYGCTSFVQWDELLKDENKYVQDDTIELKIEITAEDPNYVDRSILRFESIEKSCDCDSVAIHRLTVENVKNLMAVRSPQFIVRGLPWYLSVYKHQTCKHGIVLNTVKSPKNFPCNVKMTAKLLSSKSEENVIKKSSTGKIQWPDNIKIVDLISYDELLKPENGYVKNDSITLEVEIKADKPADEVSNLAAKRSRFECSICFKDIDSQHISATPCCHLFCTACITEAVRKSPVCPLCKKAVQLNDLRRMYLSAEE